MALVADDRCLVAGQTDQTENGIYVVDTGTWSRAPDFDSNRDIAEGTQVRVIDGSNAGVYVLTTSDPITLGTSNIVFVAESSLIGGALLASNNLSDLGSAIAGWDALARYTGSVAAAAGTLDLSTATAPLLLWTAGATSTVTLAQNKVRLARTSAEISVTCSSTLIVNGSTSGVHKIPTDTLVMFIGDAASVVRLFTLSSEWSKGADVASSGTIVLRPRAMHHITGTTTITDVDFLPAADGAQAWVYFDAAPLITYNATTLKTPTSANIQAAAGDRALIIQDSGDNVIVLVYQKADGTALVASSYSTTGQTLAVFGPADYEPPSSNYAQFGVRNLHPYLAFDTTTGWSAVFSGVLPRRYAGGGLTVVLHTMMASATSGTIGWLISIERMDDSSLDLDADSFASTQTIAAATVPGTSGQTLIQTGTFTSGAQMDSLVAGEQYRLKITRDVANDNAAGDAQLVMVELRET